MEIFILLPLPLKDSHGFVAMIWYLAQSRFPPLMRITVPGRDAKRAEKSMKDSLRSIRSK
jgi:hypothetical protein